MPHTLCSFNMKSLQVEAGECVTSGSTQHSPNHANPNGPTLRTNNQGHATYRIRFRCTHSPLPISIRRQVSNPRCVIASAFHTETRRNLSITSLHGQRTPTPSHTSSLRASSVRARRSRQNTARRFTHRSCASMSPHPHGHSAPLRAHSHEHRGAQTRGDAQKAMRVRRREPEKGPDRWRRRGGSWRSARSRS